MNLNENQRLAVTCDLSPTLVIAGPGTGKTNVIVHRINYMINVLNCSPSNILVVTFSKLAAEEMKDRYYKMFGSNSVTFGTLHSIFYKILRTCNPDRYSLDNLLAEDKKRKLLETLIKQYDISEDEDFLELFISHMSRMKNELINPNLYNSSGISKNNFMTLIKEYESYKERNTLFDFDDMLVDCYYILDNNIKLLKTVQSQYKYLLIDEFQDINEVQFQIIKKIVQSQNSIFVVGDDDQSIYQFRGAKPQYLLEFNKHFKDTKTIYLNINYRSSKTILEHSAALISNNTTRFSKTLSTPNPTGILPEFINCYDIKEEAMIITKEIIKYKSANIPLKDIAIIFRTNIQARSIVEALLGANISFCLREHIVSLYDQWITKDLLAYLSLANNINQPELAKKIINKPKRYINQISIQKASSMDGHFFMNLISIEELSEWQKDYIHKLLYDLQILREKETLDSLSNAIKYIRETIGYDKYVTDYAKFRNMPVSNLIDVLDDIEESAKSYNSYLEWECMLRQMAEKLNSKTKNINEDMVNLSTMHGSKGLEFRVVFISGLVEGVIPHKKSYLIEDVEEERRLLYVAMTRAKQKLYLFSPKLYHNKEVNISPFILELQKQILSKNLKVGKKIHHKVLGSGVITDILQKHIINVKFDAGNSRKIDSHYALNNDIITMEDENNEKTI